MRDDDRTLWNLHAGVGVVRCKRRRARNELISARMQIGRTRELWFILHDGRVQLQHCSRARFTLEFDARAEQAEAQIRIEDARHFHRNDLHFIVKYFVGCN